MATELKLTVGEVEFTNEDIALESFEYSASLCSESTIKFGKCEASYIKVRLRTSEELAGKTMLVEITCNGIYKRIGNFKVFTDKQTADKKYKDIVAYDLMYDILKADVIEWYNDIFVNQEKIALNIFRNSFFDYLGIKHATVTLPNDSMIVEKTVDASALTGANVIKAICEINGCFGHIDNADVFQYVFLESTNTHPISVYRSANNEDYYTKPINKLQIRQSEDDIGLIYGSGDNCYIVQNNFLVYGKSSSELSTIASALYGRISDVTYMPAKIIAKGDLSAELGQYINIEGLYGTISTYILERVLSGIQSLKDTYTAKGTETMLEKVNSTHEDIIQLKGKTNKLFRNIEETKLQIDNVEDGLHSEIVQTASEFDVKIEQMQKEIDKEIQVYNLTYDPTLTNYPAWDWTYNIPCNNTVRLRDDLAFEYRDEWWAKNARTIVYNLETNITYRFQKKDGAYGWFPTGDTEYSYILKQMAEFDVKVDGISASVSSLSQSVANDYIKTVDAKSLISQTSKEIMLSVSTDYVTKKTAEGYETKEHAESTIKLTSDAITAEVNRAKGEEGSLSSRITQTAESISSEVTRAQGAESSLSSKIEQTASSIRQEVSAGYATKASLELKIDKSDNGQIISMINASANEINLKGNRISIVSDYFTLEHSGRITAVSGKIGGWDIASNGIVKESQYGKVLLQADGTLAMIDKSNNVKWALQCDGNFQLPGIASVGSVEALSARIGTIEANYITAGTVAANYATIGNLNATNAAVSGKLSTSNLYSEIANLDFISVKGLWHAGHHISPLSISVNGVIRTVLAYDLE